jgi:hypothetical protein
MSDYLPWLSGAFGLIGAVIGAAASFGAILIQSKMQDRRAAIRHAAELGLADYKLRMQIALPGTKFPPAALFIAYEMKIMKLLEKGKLTPEAYKRLSREQDELHKAVFETASERAAEVRDEI